MINSSALLSNIPIVLRDDLITCYLQVVRNYTESRWEPTELNGGKFCEIVYTIIDGATSGVFAPNVSKPARFIDACRDLEKRPANLNRVGDRSLRILIPRLLPFLYEIRNNRGVGHVSGDVSPNREDSETVLSTVNWVMAELVRIFHNVSLAEAQFAVDKLVERRHPLVWSISNIKRVLDPKMSKSNQVLVLLYSESSWTSVTDLFKWVEYSTIAMFKSRVLRFLHIQRLIEYDLTEERAQITPRGIQKVEEILSPEY